MGYMVPVGLSNKHVHLTAEDIETLFGKGHQLTPMKALKQPDQFASEEKVDVVGPKGTLKGLRVLGPARPGTQVELAMTDARAVGIEAPIRESGKLEGSAGAKLVGPAGEVNLKEGVIIALRHVHLSTQQAIEAGVKDKQMVSLKFGGVRGLVFDNVLIRSGEAHLNEIHLDTDEGNAAGLSNGVMGEIIA